MAGLDSTGSDAEFFIDPGTNRGRCNLCNLELTSAEHAQQHITGKKHMKERNKNQTLREAFSGGDTGARVSGSGLLSPGSGLLNPGTGIPYAGSQRSTTGNEVFGTGDLGSSNPSEVSARGDVAASIAGLMEVDGGTGSQGANQVTSPNVNVQRIEHEVLYENGQVWHKCIPCNKPLNTAEQLRQHQASPKHKKMRDKWLQYGALLTPNFTMSTPPNLAGVTSNPSTINFLTTPPNPMCDPVATTSNPPLISPSDLGSPSFLTTDSSTQAQNTTGSRVVVNGQMKFRCEPCQCYLDTQKMLDDHSRSPRHEKAVQRASMAVAGGASPGQTLGVDSTVWHQCDVCQKKLNSAKQLQIHRQSHRSPDSGASGAPTGGGLFTDGVAMTTTQSVAKILNFDADISDIEVVTAGTPLTRKRDSPRSDKVETTPPKADIVIRLDDSRDLLTEVSKPIPSGASSVVTDSVKSTPATAPSDFDNLPPERATSSVVCDYTAGGDTVDFVNALADGMSDINMMDAEPVVRATGAEVMALQGVGPAIKGTASKEVGLMGADPVRGSCDFEPCYYHCGVCDMHLSGEQPKKDHMQGMKHLKQLKKKGLLGAQGGGALVADGYVPITQKPISANTPQGFYNYCDVCKVPFSGPEAQAAHDNSSQHQAKVARSSIAPTRDLPLTVKHCVDSTDTHVLTGVEPRNYQIELYRKAMAADSVIFLPTGTGKTLVGVMVIAKLLKENPTRPAVFLVDKVLLVIQQAQYIRAQLDGKIFNRFDYDERRLVRRQLRIAALCGEQQDVEDTGGIPVWQHDIIVITADYYRNLLADSSLYWADNSLVVFDEAHHCTKEHPFNVLLRDYHWELPLRACPKILGLTASPAGKSDVKKTKHMLKILLENMGNVHIQMVDEEVDELEKYRSSAKIVIEELIQHPLEDLLVQTLLESMELCCRVLLDEPGIEFWGGVVPKALRDIKGYASLYKIPGSNMADFSEKLEDVLENSREALVTRAERVGGKIKAVWSHLAGVINVYFDLDELGFDLGCDQLRKLGQERIGGFDDVERRGIPCEMLRGILERVTRDRAFLQGAQRDGFATKKQCLVHKIKTMVNWADGKSREDPRGWPMVMVLVKRREYAAKLTEWLQECQTFKELGLRATRLVGHGAGKSDGGMSVKQQEKVLSNIRAHKYDVIVATSVAEEGLDIPECELIIQLDPPNNITPLIQVRGRARKRGSHYILVCKSHDQAEELRDLMRREEYMIQAVTETIQEQRKKSEF